VLHLQLTGAVQAARAIAASGSAVKLASMLVGVSVAVPQRALTFFQQDCATWRPSAIRSLSFGRQSQEARVANVQTVAAGAHRSLRHLPASGDVHISGLPSVDRVPEAEFGMAPAETERLMIGRRRLGFPRS